MVGESAGHHPIGLVAVLGGKLAVPVQHLGRRLQLFRVAGPVRRDLGRPRSLSADLLEVLLNLPAPGTRRLKVIRSIALDLRLTVLAALDLVAEILKPRRKLRPVDRGGELLRLEESALL